MPLTNLLALASPSPILQRLTSRLQAGEPRLVVSGLAGSALPLLIALCHRPAGRPTLAVVENPEAAEQVKDDLASLLGDEAVYPFPDWEVLPYEHQSPDSEVVGLRLRALDALHRRRPVVVVAPVRALVQKTIPPSLLAAVSLSLRVGGTLSFHAFLSRLVRLGFERAEIVQAPGFFSVRGGIIDLFPFGVERPFRLELFGDDVESIREFDVYTQRSTSTLDRVDILPNREVVIDPATLQDTALRALIAAERAGLDGAELEARILTGGLFEGVERYLPFYHPDAASILAYLPLDGLVCLCEPSRLREQADAYAHEVEEGYAKAVASEEVVPPPADAFEPFDALLDRLTTYQTAHLTRAANASGLSDPQSAIHNPQSYAVAAVPTGSFHGALDVLQKRLAEWRGQHAAILVVCDNTGQADRLTELLGPEGDGLCMAVGNLHAGFVIPDLPLVVLTDAEVFSRYRRRQRRRPFKEGILIEDFTSLTEGDYVVHIDHGIGRYLGLQRLVVDERERDCLMIAYADDDRLYIPIEQLHRVQKYIGADGEIPSLSRLGGKAWEQIKARTKKAVQDMAQELIALYAARQARPGFGFSPDTHWQRELEDSFIYEETPDQLKATEEIKGDMERAAPMDRLVCGDVGYGKTEVAIRAAFKAVMDGKQVAVLVPTTILAQQHLTTFSERLADYPVSVQMLSRFKTPQEQKQIIDGLASGAVDIVIGTHRLIQRDITLRDLGLVIIDEEQRFGVAHKERLKRLKQTVDVLTMTATPIPRTMHMSLVGARDMSIINTPPKDRLPVHTEVVRFDEEVIREAILREVDRGGQVFFVHNRVQSIDAMVHFLQRLLPQVSFAIGHGQMPERMLERVMVKFLARKYDCLVSTMIIESGLDIPNVNTIIVNRADRFGLAQLYQLRGRVGRSNHRAYAYLFIPTSGQITPDARKRLAVIAEYTALGSGFHIAMRDLEIRGAGNLLGPEQHGFMAAVGFDLYCRLLQEAIREVKGEPVEETPEPTVDLRMGAFIPDEYVPDRRQKVAFYQRLARTTAEDQVEAIREELRDRFGRLPDPTRALLDLVSIKLLARTARLRSVTMRGRELTMAYPDQRYPTKTQLADLTSDRRLAIEFPHGKTFQIKVGLAGTTEAERVESTKNLLQKLAGGVI